MHSSITYKKYIYKRYITTYIIQVKMSLLRFHGSTPQRINMQFYIKLEGVQEST